MIKTKMKIWKKLPAIGLGLILIYTLGLTAFAHGLETHKTQNLCTDDYYQKWWGSGQCDPANPKDVSGGITKESNPSGLCYPSFNNFTDEVQSNGHGLDPYDTYPALFKDERNFFKVGKVEAGKSFSPLNFKNELTVEEGDELLFLVYMHNDGDPCLNEDITTKSGFLKDWITTAYDTTLRISGVTEGVTLIDRQTTVSANIKGKNVVNEYGRVGEPTTDTVILKTKNNAKLNLELIEDSTQYVDMRNDANFVSWYNTHKIDNPVPLFKKGLPLTTLLVDGKFKSSGGEGVHYASEPYIGLVRFKLKVKKPAPNVCEDLSLQDPYKLTDLELEKLTGSKGLTMYKLGIKNLKFSETDLPENAKIKFTTTDQNGKFWVEQYKGGISSKGVSVYEVNAKSFIEGTINNAVYYTGEGKVTATVTGLKAEEANTSKCTDYIVFEKDVEETVCKEIFVDHPKTIYKGTISNFNAEITDQNDKKFVSYVEYSVDYGYGIFMTEYPAGNPANPSEMVYDTDNPTPVTNFIIDSVMSDKPEKKEKKEKKSPDLGKLNPGTIDFVKISVFDLPQIPYTVSSGEYTVKSKALPTDTSIETISIDATETYADDIEQAMNDKYKNLEAPKYQKIVVAQGTKVFFLALKPGKNVVHIKAINGSENPDCVKDYSIEVYNECDAILVNHQKTILEGTISRFSAKATDTLNGLFHGKIKYSVDKGYGTFYTVKPEGNDNPALPVTEFTGKFTKPEGGWCEDKTVAATPASTPTVKKFGLGSVFDLDLGEPVELGTLDKPAKSAAPTTPAGNIKMPKNLSIVNQKTTPVVKIDPTKSVTKEIQDELAAKFKNLTDVKGVPTQSGNSITVNPGQVVYFKAEKAGTSKIHVEAECTDEKACKRDFDIKAAYNQCAELKIKDNPGTIKADGSYEFKLTGKDLLGGDLPAGTKVIWTTTTNGKIVKETGTVTQSVTFTDAKKSGVVKVTVDPTDPMYSPACADLITVEKEEILECLNLDTTLTKKYPSDTKVSQLEPGEIYTISGKPTFSGPKATALMDYEINTDIGTFIVLGNTKNATKYTVYAGLKLLQSTGNLTKDGVDKFMDKMKALSQQIWGAPVPGVSTGANEDVYLVIYSDATQTGLNTLSANVPGFTNPECADAFPLELAPKECVNLMIEPVRNTFDPTEEYSMLKLTGNYADHNGPVKVTTTCGKLAKTSDAPAYTNEITFTKDEVQKSDNTLTFVFKGDKSCEGVTISAKGVGTPAGKCEDTLSKYKPGDDFKCVELNIITPSYPWEIDPRSPKSQLFQVKAKTSPAGYENTLDYSWTEENAESWLYGDKTSVGINKLNGIGDNTKVTVYALDQNGKRIDDCKDSIKVKSDDEPQIRKSVYPLGEYTKITDFILNISSPKYLTNAKNKYLTYKIEFANGSEREVELREKELKGGALKGLEGYGGKLQYKGMRINVSDGGNNKYTVLKTDGYTDDKDDHGFEENGNGDNPQRYEDDYKCDSGDFAKASTQVVSEPRVCIEGKFEAARAKFLDGLPIKFKNLKNTTQIIIKIQMRNDTVIDEALCKILNATKGCGETFRNTAEFLTPKKYTGKDDAKVIVICPYILTRQGGDTFFHDVIETGVDVAKCSPVKGSTGTVITPQTGQTPELTSSGLGKTPEEAVILDLPSHDVCRFSNSNTNLEGYNDVLSNFSSTICELRADVAESWKEKNVVKAINDNVTRISRFGTNLRNATINNMNALDSSGVYVQEGGTLTIKLTDKLGPKGDVPAAQTYIVKGGTLKILSNIEYKEINSTNFLKPTTIPSAAFIVIDGNIEIDPSVTHIDGILMAVDTDGSGDTGKILNSGNIPSEKILTINGSLIGNVIDLFKERVGVGDPTKDEGSVTIKYDERIILNTPPVISEFIDLKR